MEDQIKRETYWGDTEKNMEHKTWETVVEKVSRFPSWFCPQTPSNLVIKESQNNMFFGSLFSRFFPPGFDTRFVHQ